MRFGVLVCQASQGETREEAIANIKDAIKSYLEVLNDYRQLI
jgi:predicted RNase H-like HicB family nuclease